MLISNYVYEKEGESRKKVIQYRHILPVERMFTWKDCHHFIIRKFGEECQRRWGITPLQVFLHKDEGHWLNGQPEAEDKESFHHTWTYL